MADEDAPLSDEITSGIKRLDLLAIAKRMECADGIRVVLAGKMTANGLGELRREVDDARRRRKPMYMDLEEVTLVDRISAEFLNSLAGGVHFENCPAYLRRWLLGNHSTATP
jgi:hypothetical protein